MAAGAKVYSSCVLLIWCPQWIQPLDPILNHLKMFHTLNNVYP